MADQFSVHIEVRGYEIDSQRHVNQAVYHQYGEHARMEHMRAADCARIGEDVGVILLESRIRYLRELRWGDEVDIDSTIVFGEGKTFRFEHVMRRRPDAEPVAEMSCVLGLLDVEKRRLLPEPRERLAEWARHPDVLGLGTVSR